MVTPKIGGSQTLLIESREIEKGQLVRKVDAFKNRYAGLHPPGEGFFFESRYS
jgi:hypothetical protein